MNSQVINFPTTRRKPPAGEANSIEAQQPVTTIQLELPASLADSIKIAAGFACKSPDQYVRDALTAIMQMETAG